MLDLPPFPGFRDEAFAFLRDLKANNRREWFKPRKATYEDEVRWPLQCLVADAAQQAQARALPFAGDPKRSLFRIYRDTRFSKDKNPYKTHAGAVLSRSGGHQENGVVYLHIEPAASFLGAGYWHPETAFLRAWRGRMADAPAAFRTVVEHLAERGLALETDDALKRMPRGYEAQADDDLADYFRWKSFLVTRPVADDELKTPAFTETVVAFAEDVLPLLDFGWALEAGR